MAFLRKLAQPESCSRTTCPGLAGRPRSLAETELQPGHGSGHRGRATIRGPARPAAPRRSMVKSASRNEALLVFRDPVPGPFFALLEESGAQKRLPGHGVLPAALWDKASPECRERGRRLPVDLDDAGETVLGRVPGCRSRDLAETGAGRAGRDLRQLLDSWRTVEGEGTQHHGFEAATWPERRVGTAFRHGPGNSSGRCRRP